MYQVFRYLTRQMYHICGGIRLSKYRVSVQPHVQVTEMLLTVDEHGKARLRDANKEARYLLTYLLVLLI